MDLEAGIRFLHLYPIIGHVPNAHSIEASSPGMRVFSRLRDRYHISRGNLTPRHGLDFYTLEVASYEGKDRLKISPRVTFYLLISRSIEFVQSSESLEFG